MAACSTQTHPHNAPDSAAEVPALSSCWDKRGDYDESMPTLKCPLTGLCQVRCSSPLASWLVNVSIPLWWHPVIYSFRWVPWKVVYWMSLWLPLILWCREVIGTLPFSDKRPLLLYFLGYLFKKSTWQTEILKSKQTNKTKTKQKKNTTPQRNNKTNKQTKQAKKRRRKKKEKRKEKKKK